MSLRCQYHGRKGTTIIPKSFSALPKNNFFYTACLDNREGDAVDFLVNVEGIDVGHAADVVDDGHETCFQVRGIDVVLARHTADEVFGVEPLGMNGRPYELLHQRLDDLITGEFDIEHRTAFVNASDGKVATTLVGFFLLLADMVDKTLSECPSENLILMVDENAYAFIFQFADHAGSQVDNLFIVVGNALFDDAVQNALLGLLVEEIQ